MYFTTLAYYSLLLSILHNSPLIIIHIAPSAAREVAREWRAAAPLCFPKCIKLNIVHVCVFYVGLI